MHGSILDIILMNTFTYYNSAITARPIQPDGQTRGKTTDHSVPVCVQQTDRNTRHRHKIKTIKYRPLSQSSLRKLGEWIVDEQ